jgi:hypothetical protein
MDAGTVFVWRVRLCLLAAALGLMHLGADKPTAVPQSMVRGQSIPIIQTVPAFSSKASPVHVGSRAVSQSLAEPLKRARSKMAVVPQSPDVRSPGRAAKSSDRLAARKPTRGQKSVGTKLSGGGTNTKIKSGVSGQRKPLASASKKRDISMRMTRDAESLKARHKLAQKGDARAGDNVAAPRQPRNRLHA